MVASACINVSPESDWIDMKSDSVWHVPSYNSQRIENRRVEEFRHLLENGVNRRLMTHILLLNFVESYCCTCLLISKEHHVQTCRCASRRMRSVQDWHRNGTCVLLAQRYALADR